MLTNQTLDEEKTMELSFRSLLLAAVLTLILAVSNAYLALKLGILVSASIPAAILSLGILRFFKNATILENNAVQTAASAGEAVAGGIAYTIPALVIIQYWTKFDYLTNFFIAFTGGVLGVLFSIPLRRILVNEPLLRFPEGRAIAMVLKTSIEKSGIRDIVFGGLVAATLELLQTGFKYIASSWSTWFILNRSLFGIGVGFSSAMIGAGYLIGSEMALSIFLGAVISRLIALPLISQFYPEIISHFSPEKAALLLWDQQMRYLGIGAMLFAGIWTFLNLLKPLSQNIYVSFQSFLLQKPMMQSSIPRTDRDLPFPWILIGILLTAAVLFLLFQFIMPVDVAGIDVDFAFTPTLIFAMVIYILILGFLFSVITSYFSAMVGVTASPGSSVIIAGILLTAWLLFKVMHHLLPLPLTSEQLKALEAITIIIGSVVTGIAAIANDNTQDLKVGQLVGATPWKQQIMLLWGVLISALIIPAVMQLLFNVYGIAGVMPPGKIDTGHTLPAPPAAVMAAVTEAVFHHTLPWNMLGIGALIILLMIGLNVFFRKFRLYRLSILGVAIGMYLPLASSFPLFLGGVIAKMIDWRVNKTSSSSEVRRQRKQRGILIACGLVAGAALVDVALSIPFSLLGSPDALSLVGESWRPYGVSLGFLSIILLAAWIHWRVKS